MTDTQPAEIWFIRHFRTPWNAEGRLQGRRDIALDDPLCAADQATLAANRAMLQGKRFRAVLTSPLQRARQTAALHGFAGAHPEPALAELDFGPWEGRLWSELHDTHPGDWHTAPHALPLGEPFADFRDRIQRLHRQLFSQPGAVLLFGHGAWFGCLQSLRNRGDGSDLAARACGNGVLTRLPPPAAGTSDLLQPRTGGVSHAATR